MKSLPLGAVAVSLRDDETPPGRHRPTHLPLQEEERIIVVSQATMREPLRRFAPPPLTGEARSAPSVPPIGAPAEAQPSGGFGGERRSSGVSELFALGRKRGIRSLRRRGNVSFADKGVPVTGGQETSLGEPLSQLALKPLSQLALKPLSQRPMALTAPLTGEPWEVQKNPSSTR